jgi:hypothetical protein
MRYSIGLAIILCVVSLTSAFADDQQKVEKQINRMTAMASDTTCRRIVSMTMADQLKVKRADLVQERRQMNLNYGSLFLAHQLADGENLKDVAASLQSGKSLMQIAIEQHANWKEILQAAKKLNRKIEENLYNYFIDDRPLRARDQADQYDPLGDSVKADSEVSPEDLEAARDTYARWQELASKVPGKQDSRLETSDEQAARHGHDHIRTGGPTPGGNMPGPVPH